MPTFLAAATGRRPPSSDKFSVSDVGHSAYDSAVTLDNIKIVTP
jgi:hypothetical protein